MHESTRVSTFDPWSSSSIPPATSWLAFSINDSPAGRSGIQAGDVVVAVDGKPVKGLVLYDVVPLFRQHGAERQVLVERKGGEKREFRFVLRREL